jgi:hypothetical protein
LEKAYTILRATGEHPIDIDLVLFITEMIKSKRPKKITRFYSKIFRRDILKDINKEC